MRTVLITGGTRGIGLDIARVFAENGHRCILTFKEDYISAQKSLKSLLEIHESIHLLQLDLASQKQITKVAECDLIRDFGLDVLVNNAGTNIVKNFDEVTEEDWDKVIDVNLKGPFFLTQRLFSHLKTSNSPRIVNISSISSLIHGPKSVPYAASKAGLNSLTRLFARYGAPFGILANGVAPGLVETELTRTEITNGASTKFLDLTLVKKLTEVNEVSDLVYFLARSEQTNITGQILSTSAGAYLG